MIQGSSLLNSERLPTPQMEEEEENLGSRQSTRMSFPHYVQIILDGYTPTKMEKFSCQQHSFVKMWKKVIDYRCCRLLFYVMHLSVFNIEPMKNGRKLSSVALISISRKLLKRWQEQQRKLLGLARITFRNWITMFIKLTSFFSVRCRLLSKSSASDILFFIAW